MKRQMHLGLFILGTGSHVAGWRYPGAVDSFQDFAAIRAIGRTAERGKHGQGFEPHRVGWMGRGIRIEIVAHEDQVELAPLGDGGDAANLVDILEIVERARIAPASDVAAGAENEEPEVDLAWRGNESAHVVGSNRSRK